MGLTRQGSHVDKGLGAVERRLLIQKMGAMGGLIVSLLLWEVSGGVMLLMGEGCVGRSFSCNGPGKFPSGGGLSSMVVLKAGC